MTSVDIEPAGTFYRRFLSDEDVTALRMEFLRWQQYWLRQPTTVQRPDCATDTLRVANKLGTYPEVSVLLHIFATLPVTPATGERRFSVLKYTKNYLRSTMNEDRLNGITHMYINRDIALDYSEVIEDFSRCNRSLSFM